MPELPLRNPDAITSNQSRSTLSTSKRMRCFELLLVLTVAIADPFFKSLYFLKDGPNPAMHIGNSAWAYGLIREIICLLLLGYVLSRRGLRIRDLRLAMVPS